MRKFCLLALGLFLCGCATAAVKDLEFGAGSPKGLFLKPVVFPEQSVVTVVRVDLNTKKLGNPIELGEPDAGLIEAASILPGYIRKSTYAAYYLDPGDYAVFSFQSSMPTGVAVAYNSFCWANFSEVLSVRAGEVTAWRIVPITVNTWPLYAAKMHHDEQYRQEADRVRHATEALANFRPTVINVVPKAFVDLAGGAVATARDCKARSIEILHILEDAGGN